MAKYLFTQRRRIVLPHRIVEAFDLVLHELAQLHEAIGELTEDDRWVDASKRFAVRRNELAKPSELFEVVRLRDHLANGGRLPAKRAKRKAG